MVLKPVHDKPRARRAYSRLLVGCVLMGALLVAAGTAVLAQGAQKGMIPDPSMWEGWLQGAPGMYEGIDQLGAQEKPMAVYFYTDWCGYCRQFERNLLSDGEVRDYMQELIRVRINPEKGPDEAELARYYGVQGFPSFFIHSNQSKVMTQVRRYSIEDGKPELLPAGKFITALKQAAAR